MHAYFLFHQTPTFYPYPNNKLTLLAEIDTWHTKNNLHPLYAPNYNNLQLRLLARKLQKLETTIYLHEQPPTKALDLVLQLLIFRALIIY